VVAVGVVVGVAVAVGVGVVVAVGQVGQEKLGDIYVHQEMVGHPNDNFVRVWPNCYRTG
jgi:hypothetical protein